MLSPWNRYKPSSKLFLLTVPRRYFFCGSFLCVTYVLCFHAFASVHCCLVFTCWLKGLTSWLLFVIFNSVFVTFPWWYPGSGVVLESIESWSLPPFLLHYYAELRALCGYTLRRKNGTKWNPARKGSSPQRGEIGQCTVLIFNELSQGEKGNLYWPCVNFWVHVT